MKIYKVISLTLVLTFSLAQANAPSLAETRGDGILRRGDETLTHPGGVQRFLRPMAKGESGRDLDNEIVKIQGHAYFKQDLDTLLRSILQNEPVIVCVSGDSGAGKTSLIWLIRNGDINIGVDPEDIVFIKESVLSDLFHPVTLRTLRGYSKRFKDMQEQYRSMLINYGFSTFSHGELINLDKYLLRHPVPFGEWVAYYFQVHISRILAEKHGRRVIIVDNDAWEGTSVREAIKSDFSLGIEFNVLNVTLRPVSDKPGAPRKIHFKEPYLATGTKKAFPDLLPNRKGTISKRGGERVVDGELVPPQDVEDAHTSLRTKWLSPDELIDFIKNARIILEPLRGEKAREAIKTFAKLLSRHERIIGNGGEQFDFDLTSLLNPETAFFATLGKISIIDFAYRNSSLDHTYAIYRDKQIIGYGTYKLGTRRPIIGLTFAILETRGEGNAYPALKLILRMLNKRYAWLKGVIIPKFCRYKGKIYRDAHKTQAPLFFIRAGFKSVDPIDEKIANQISNLRKGILSEEEKQALNDAVFGMNLILRVDFRNDKSRAIPQDDIPQNKTMQGLQSCI